MKPRLHGPAYHLQGGGTDVDAAAALFCAGKVRCLLVSGDHGTRYYNEVDAMRKGLVESNAALSASKGRSTHS